MAGGANAVRAGRAYVELYADGSQFNAGLRAASARMKRFGASMQKVGRGMMLVGAAAVGPLVAASKIFSSVGDAAAKTARRIGLTTEAVSELGYAAKISGSSAEAFEKSFKGMSRVVFDAQRGTQDAADSLGLIGVSIRDLEGLSPEEQFLKLGAAIGGMTDPTLKAAAAQRIFGRSGNELIPMFNAGEDGIKRLREEAKRLGLSISGEDAAAAEVFTDRMTDLWESLKMVAFQVGAAVAPALTSFANWVVEATQGVREWVKHNREIIETALKIGAALVAIGATVFVIGKVVAIFGSLLGAVTLVSGAIKGVGIALTFITAHPIIAAITAVTAAVLALAAAFALASSESRPLQRLDLSVRAERLTGMWGTGRGDVQRQQDIAKVKTLEQYGKRAQLSQDEMANAEALIADLTDRYGDLGVAVDKAAAKVTGTADRLGDPAMGLAGRAAGAMGARAALETQTELDKINEALSRSAGLADSDSRKMAAADVKALEARRVALEARIKGIAQAQASGATYSPELLTGASESEILDKRLMTAEQAAAAELDWARRVEVMRIEAIENEAERARKLIDDRYDHEIARAKEAGANQALIDSMNAARGLELAKAAADAKRRSEEEAALETARMRQGLVDRQRAVEDLQLEQKFEGEELARARIDLDEKRAVAELAAEEKRLRDAGQAEAADFAREQIAYAHLEFGMRRQILDAANSAKQTAEMGVVGTFNPQVARSLGAAGVGKQLLDASQQTAQNTKKLVEKSDDNAPQFT